MSKFRKEIDYWGAGFLVKLRNFPVYVDDGEHLPDVPLGRLHRDIAYEVVKKPHLLTGNELAFLRAQANLTRSEMARRIGVTRRTLINWEESLDDPIKASPIAQLGLRLRLAGWIFPNDTSLLALANDLNDASSRMPVTIEHSYPSHETGLDWIIGDVRRSTKIIPPYSSHPELIATKSENLAEGTGIGSGGNWSESVWDIEPPILN